MLRLSLHFLLVIAWVSHLCTIALTYERGDEGFLENAFIATLLIDLLPFCAIVLYGIRWILMA